MFDQWPNRILVVGSPKTLPYELFSEQLGVCLSARRLGDYVFLGVSNDDVVEEFVYRHAKENGIPVVCATHPQAEIWTTEIVSFWDGNKNFEQDTTHQIALVWARSRGVKVHLVLY